MKTLIYRVFVADRVTGHESYFDVPAISEGRAADQMMDAGWLVRNVLALPAPVVRGSARIPEGRSIILWIALIVWTTMGIVWSLLVLAYGAPDYKAIDQEQIMVYGLQPNQAARDAATSGWIAAAVLLPACVWLPVALPLFIAAVVTWPKRT